ncbi:tRNA (adenine(37)-N6)-methyltransferase [Astyanax mexicanus]|uniref:tRNA (adenine(37)-N6)-methyltransferase n=1 Tax=Astyanax mexicanus TaxID=7994 RepID=UPI0020CAFF8B|nr:tRNA (adenine(37)-N6)-methyltransferase [Astyanax mexicanus]
MMSSCSCREQSLRLNQQVNVMRKEIKNLRQQIDSAVRAHRKHMSSLQSELEIWSRGKPQKRPAAPDPQPGPEISLEKGCIQTVPIGYIDSCFSRKNGTPRQPAVCTVSRASLQIQPSVFNNPDHALTGLENYSHVWLIFLFHKNGHLSYKAKVKPPRLNGQKVGVYSTRSPHRPNAIGLTLAKLESITGDTLHLSGVDLISGTPVLDIKPYIPDYDSPSVTNRVNLSVPEQTESMEDSEPEPEPEELQNPAVELSAPVSPPHASENFLSRALAEVRDYLQQGAPSAESSAEEKPSGSGPEPEPGLEREDTARLSYGADSYSSIADWIRNPPVSKLSVRFTPTAQSELAQFLPPHSTEWGRPKFQFLKGADEAEAAVRGILAADPRSVYRRTRCRDRLFFFTLDSAEITCWFGDGFAEVLRVRPVQTQEIPT